MMRNYIKGLFKKQELCDAFTFHYDKDNRLDIKRGHISSFEINGKKYRLSKRITYMTYLAAHMDKERFYCTTSDDIVGHYYSGITPEESEYQFLDSLTKDKVFMWDGNYLEVQEI